jgi:4-amino-4-deoxy-L-arabinose transferase-like glycosyltransferase
LQNKEEKNNIYGHNEDKYKNNSLTILVVIAVMSSQIIWSPILILKIEFTIKRNTKNLKIVILHLNVNNMKNL